METTTAENLLHQALLEILQEVLPESLPPERQVLLKLLAMEKAEALAQLHPELLTHLNATEVDQICEALDFHYDMTPLVEKDEQNKALVGKIRTLCHPAA